MLATIITIGDEILIGQIVDTNSAWMANKLNEIGIKIHEIISVSDNESHILEAVDKSMKQSDIVFITGGLGPTKDDITKATLCKYFNAELILNEALLTQLTAYFKQRGRVMNESNKMQAYVPDNCEVIPNERGTAKGMWFEKDNRILLSMPGVPHEMKHIMEDHILQRLQRDYALPYIHHKNIMTAGLGESYIAEKISDIEDGLPAHIKLAYLPHLGAVRLRLTGRGKVGTDLIEEINRISASITDRIAFYVYGFDELKLEEALGNLLKKHQKTISTAESCTGGSVAAAITSVPGSSAYYEGSLITYSYEVKQRELGVKAETLAKYGAVSTETVEEMLVGILGKMNTDYGIAISGVAGPGGGTPEKPVGTVYVCVGNKTKMQTKRYQLTQNRADNIALTTTYALFQMKSFMDEVEGLLS